MFLQLISTNPGLYIGWIVIVGFSICVHEYAHALTALVLGDDTAAEAGHLSLNPMVQMGPMSLVMLALLGIAWGMVPMNVRQLRHPRFAGLVAIAGPVANLLLSAVFSLLYMSAALYGWGGASVDLFRVGAMTNGALFVLNLIPIPPLDGFSVAGAIFPALNRLPNEVIRQASFVLLLLLFLTDLFHFVWSTGEGISRSFEGLWMMVLRG